MLRNMCHCCARALPTNSFVAGQPVSLPRADERASLALVAQPGASDKVEGSTHQVCGAPAAGASLLRAHDCSDRRSGCELGKRAHFALSHLGPPSARPPPTDGPALSNRNLCRADARFGAMINTITNPLRAMRATYGTFAPSKNSHR